MKLELGQNLGRCFASYLPEKLGKTVGIFEHTDSDINDSICISASGSLAIGSAQRCGCDNGLKANC